MSKRRRQPLAHHDRDRYLLEDWTDTMTTQPQLSLPAQARALDRHAIVDGGRMGTALAGALSAAALDATRRPARDSIAVSA
ncbi:MAG: hypothetical protein Q8O56_05570 [Solirubrobacteraceae bacterium]|nr:hypothetical protein [Solirubrobacteraceae bacterium]